VSEASAKQVETVTVSTKLAAVYRESVTPRKATDLPIPVLMSEDGQARYVMSVRLNGDGYSSFILHEYVKGEHYPMVSVHEFDGGSPGTELIEKLIEKVGKMPGSQALISLGELAEFFIEAGARWDAPHAALIKALPGSHERNLQLMPRMWAWLTQEEAMRLGEVDGAPED
jgi:hypothetical protein